MTEVVESFQPTRPLRGATRTLRTDPRAGGISTHAPLAGRDLYLAASRVTDADFNPRAPCGARLLWSGRCFYFKLFQPTRPLRGATFKLSLESLIVPISTHAPLAGRDHNHLQKKKKIHISTHAPLAGRDTCTPSLSSFASIISTHAPLAGRDCKRVQITMHIFAITDKFQMLLHRMPPARAFCSFLMQENHADFGCEPPK